MNEPLENRRPLKTRGTAWAKAFAKFLTKSGATPNSISILSILFALLSGSCFALRGKSGENILLLLGVFFLQLRLACNLFDGMVAIEGGKQTRSGEVFNEAPDRLADVLIILGFSAALTQVSYAIHLGWAAALLAVLTAYIRALGVACGAGNHFLGPMAKQHRMFILSLAAILGLIEAKTMGSEHVLHYALWVVIIGSVITCWRRLGKILEILERP